MNGRTVILPGSVVSKNMRPLSWHTDLYAGGNLLFPRSPDCLLRWRYTTEIYGARCSPLSNLCATIRESLIVPLYTSSRLWIWTAITWMPPKVMTAQPRSSMSPKLPNKVLPKLSLYTGESELQAVWPMPQPQTLRRQQHRPSIFRPHQQQCEGGHPLRQTQRSTRPV